MSVMDDARQEQLTLAGRRAAAFAVALRPAQQGLFCGERSTAEDWSLGPQGNQIV